MKTKLQFTKGFMKNLTIFNKKKKNPAALAR